MKRLFSLLVVTTFLLSSCGGNAAPALTQTPVTQAPATQAPLTPAPVTNTPPATAVVNPPDCTNSAAFVTDITVPDNAKFNQGEKFNKIWRIKNTGTCTWTEQYTLAFYHGDQMDAPTTTPLSVTKPDDTLDIAVNMTAPAKERIYRADFKMYAPSGAVIPVDKESLLWVIIQVGKDTASRSGSGDGGVIGPIPVTSNCNFSIDQTRVNQTVEAINAYRAKNGLPPYIVNADLVTAAQFHSADMACHNLFGHTSSDGSTPASRVAATGFIASALSENVYGSYPPLTPAGAVNWWAADQIDPRHNENLVSAKYTRIGVGYAFFNNYGYYVVDFAAP